jgi:hypothetical protein
MMKRDGRTISECRTLSGTMARPGVAFASMADLFYMIPPLPRSRLFGVISVLSWLWLKSRILLAVMVAR